MLRDEVFSHVSFYYICFLYFPLLFLHFFVKVATLNNLDTTPSVKALQSALVVVGRGGDLFTKSAESEWKATIAQLDKPASASTVRNLIVHGIPLFNIWDCISFIYTVCAEDVKTPLETQLHLVQFRVIIKSLRSVSHTSTRSWTYYCSGDLDQNN
jgi:hypothetical protein